MPDFKMPKALWNDFVAIAEKRNQSPELLVRTVLREFVQRFTDDELLERSAAAARRAPFRIEESEEVVRQYRRNRSRQ